MTGAGASPLAPGPLAPESLAPGPVAPSPEDADARDAARHRALAVPRRTAIWRLLRSTSGELAVPEVAAAVGLGVSAAREHLEALVEAGLVRRGVEHRTTRGRPRALYAAAGGGAVDPEWVRHHLSRVLLSRYGQAPEAPEAVADRSEAALLAERGPGVPSPPGAAGEVRARQLAALHEHLDVLGFDPVDDPGGAGVRLRRCPVLDLARDRPDVVCLVHLGLARGALALAGGPVAATGIDPFAGPGWCLLRLEDRAG